MVSTITVFQRFRSTPHINTTTNVVPETNILSRKIAAHAGRMVTTFIATTSDTLQNSAGIKRRKEINYIQRTKAIKRRRKMVFLTKAMSKRVLYYFAWIQEQRSTASRTRI